MFWVWEPVLLYDCSLFKFYIKHTYTQTSSNSHCVYVQCQCKPRTKKPIVGVSLNHKPGSKVHSGSSLASAFNTWDNPLLSLRAQKPQMAPAILGWEGTTAHLGPAYLTTDPLILSYSICLKAKKSKEEQNGSCCLPHPLKCAKYLHMACLWGCYSQPVRIHRLSPLCREETRARRV